jgi:hypothetical protein
VEVAGAASNLETGVEDAARQPNRLLADLTAVMRATAESGRQTTMDQCQADAAAYLERMRVRREEGVKELEKIAAQDQATIESQSKAGVERVRGEADRRITRRREILEQELIEYRAAVDRELERVQERVATFEKEIAEFFEQLEGSDPATFATMASHAPEQPILAELDLEALGKEVRGKHEAARAEAATASGGEELPPGWWLDSPGKPAAEAGAATHRQGKA